MNYIGAREGVPVPKVPYDRAGHATWVVCNCGHKGRPGAFHICVDLGTPEPEVKPKPPPVVRTRRRRPPKPPPTRCECGKPLEKGARRQCRECFIADHPKPECGTTSGYNWHRRQAMQDPANNPWPLPAEDKCGCRGALAEASRLRRLQEKGEAA